MKYRDTPDRTGDMGWGALTDTLCTVRTIDGGEVTARIDSLGNGHSVVVRREDGPWYSIPANRVHSLKAHPTPPEGRCAIGPLNAHTYNYERTECIWCGPHGLAWQPGRWVSVGDGMSAWTVTPPPAKGEAE